MDSITKLLISFSDRPNENITIELNKNALLYGLNGHGKTRVLKTIQLLLSFVKKDNVYESFDVLKELNLKTLKINGLSYETVFSVKESILDKQLNSIITWRDLNYAKLKLFVELGYQFCEKIIVNDYIPESDKKRLTIVINKFNQIIHSKMRNISPEEILSLFKELLSLTDSIRRGYIHDKNEYISSIASDFSFSGRSLYMDFRKILLDRDVDLMNQLKFEKNKIKKALSSISTHYISTENLSFDILEQRIARDLLNFKEEFFKGLWNKGFSESLQSINKYHRKIRKLNQLLRKYMGVDVNINEKGVVTFTKSDCPISFDKLSSGEKRLIILFSNIVFYDVNIYLIDEPELSLSLDFQNKIVYDLYKLIEKSNMIVATHAPFIFEDFKRFEDVQIINV